MAASNARRAKASAASPTEAAPRVTRSRKSPARQAAPDSAQPEAKSARSSTRRAATPAARQDQMSEAELAEVAALQERMRALGQSPADLAQALGVSRTEINRFLAGKAAASGTRNTLAGADGIRRVELALRLMANEPARTPARKAKPRKVPAAVQPPLLAVIQPDAPAAPVDCIRERADTRTCRILIVEDDASTVHLYRMILAEDEQPVRYDVSVARSAMECKDLLETVARFARFDVLLMDLGVGEIVTNDASVTLLTWLKAHRDLLPRHVLVVSGIAPDKLKALMPDLLAIGARYLPKPFDITDLLAAVHATLGVVAHPAASLPQLGRSGAR